jgi:hypothetical protein
MAPTFRSSRSGRQFADNSANRNRSGQVDHDVFEGLPIRRWSRQPYTFSQAPNDEPESQIQVAAGNQRFPELSMPRDSHLLSPMSRALLRAARAGCIYIRHIGKDAAEEEEKDNADVEESVPIPKMEQSFHARKWAVLPKHLEPSEVEFLAKRRSGLPSLYGGVAASNVVSGGTGNGNVQLRKTRFKKVDPNSGKISIHERWIPEGHTIEGEILDDITVSEQREMAAPNKGSAFEPVMETFSSVTAEPVTVAASEPVLSASPAKTRLYPPKRKAKGPGKGRRKKVMFAPGEGVDASRVHTVIGHPTVTLKNGGVTNVPVEAAAITGDSMNQQVEDEEEEEDEEDVEEREDGGKESSQPEVKSSEISTQNIRTTTTRVHNFASIPEPSDRRLFEPEIEAVTKPAETQQQRTPSVQQYLPQKRADSTTAMNVDIPARKDTHADSHIEISRTPNKHSFEVQIVQSPLTNTTSRPFSPSVTSIFHVTKSDSDHGSAGQTVISQIIEPAPAPVALDRTHDFEIAPVPLGQVTPLGSVTARDTVLESANNLFMPALSAIPQADRPILREAEIVVQSAPLSRAEEEEVDLLNRLGDEKAITGTEINMPVSSTAIPLIAAPAVVEDVNASATAAGGVRFPTENTGTQGVLLEQ